MSKLSRGDIFTIPIDEETIGHGQIVFTRSQNFLIIVFEGRWGENISPNLDDIVNSKILFMGYTMDAKLYHKHWVVIGNLEKNLEHIQLPLYKLGTPPDEIFLLDHTGAKLRPCSESEFSKLKYLKVVAPIRYEKALKANYGVADWRDDFDELRVENLLSGRNSVSP